MLPSLWNRTGLSPFERLYDFRREMDRLFEGAAHDTNGTMGNWLPPMDVVETAEAILCRLEVPGMSADDLDIRVEGNLVSIAGEKKYEQRNGENETGYRHVERRYGRFERSFTIPRTVEADKVRAGYENGILTVELPKAEQAKPRRVAIENGTPGRKIES
jgi:HSP20 family protein